MVRIANINIPDNKRIPFSLKYIYGVGKPRALNIIKKLGIDEVKKAKDLTADEIGMLNKELNNIYIEDKLRRKIKEIIDNERKLNTYQGERRGKLPVNGQHTRRNARTAKGGGKKKTVANKKKPSRTGKK